MILPPFKQLFREHAPDVGRILRNVGVSEAELSDVLFAAFTVVHGKLPSFRGASSLRIWIIGICLRELYAYRRRPKEPREAPEEPVRPERLKTVEDVERRLGLAKLDGALAKLDADRRAVLVLYELEELTLAEIAVATGEPVPVVYSWLMGARHDIQSVFGAKSPPEGGEAAKTDHDPPGLLRGAEGVSEELLRALRAARGRRVGEALIAAVAAKLPAEPPGRGQAKTPGPAPRPLPGGPLGGAPPSPLRAAQPRQQAPSKPPPPPPEPELPSIWPAAALGASLGAFVGSLWLVATPAPKGQPPPAPAQSVRIGVSNTAVSDLTAQGVSSARPSPAETGSAAATGSAPAEAEAEYLRSAQEALSSDPERALRLAEAHPQRYPDGKLGQERELIAVLALSALGRKTEARARAKLFLMLFPDSPHRKRIQELVPDATPDPLEP